MKKLCIALLLATFLGVALSAVAADKEKPNQGNNPIAEFYGWAAKLTMNHRWVKGTEYTDIKLQMMPAEGGKNIEFVFPESDPSGKPFALDDTTKAFLNALKILKPSEPPGANNMYHVTYNVQGGMHVCQHIEAYTPIPGEDEPNVYVFVGADTPAKGMPIVSATKFKKTFKFVLPAAKGPGKPVADPKMLDALKKFKPNDLLEIELDRGAVKTLKLWEPPKMADLNAISKNDKGFTTLEVVDALDTKTLIVPKNKGILVGKLRPLLKENAKSKSVLYHAVPDETDSSILWVKDIRPTPENYVAPEVASSKTPADTASAGTEKEGVFWSTGKMKPFRSDDTVDYIEIQTPGPDAEHVMREKYMVTIKESPTVMPKIAGMKQGTPVTFKFTESLQGKWISDIKVKDTKPPASKPGDEKKPPEKPAEKPA